MFFSRFWLILAFFAVLLFITQAFAQFGDLPHDAAFIDIGLVADNAQ